MTAILIPQLKKLRKIRDSFLNMNIYARGTGYTYEDKIKEKESLEALKKKLDEYEFNYTHLESYIKWFILLIVITLLILFVNQILYSGLRFELLVLLFTAIIEIIIIVFILVGLFVPSFEKISQIVYLINNFNYKPKYLINITNMCVNFSNTVQHSPKREDPLIIHLFSTILLIGFRYFLIIQSEDYKKTYFVSFGPINKLRNCVKYTGGEIETLSITIGKAPLNLIDKKQNLHVKLLFFCGFYKGSANNPRKIDTDYEVSKDKIFMEHSGGSQLNDAWIEHNITFSGYGEKIKKIDCNTNGENYLSIFKKYQNKFIRANKVKMYFDLKGALYKKGTVVLNE